jgi:quinol monooxygenase YgiN/thioesterase domain-containing protein
MLDSQLIRSSLFAVVAMFSLSPAMSRDHAGILYDDIPDGAYAVVADVRAKKGKEDELRAITLPLVAKVRAEPNNLLYFLHEDREAPGHFVFYEIFATQADFEAHNATPHVQAWFKHLPELAQGGVNVVRMQILGNRTTAQPTTNVKLPTVVLVHGAFADGSGWAGVYRILRAQGYPVTVVQQPTVSLSDDVAYVKRAIAAAEGPVILVGHSYGGVVITEAGIDEKVAALVYVAAFAPDQGESVSTLNANAPPGVGPPILPPQDGFLQLDRSKFPAVFAADVAPDVAAFMASSQVPWGVRALEGKVTDPAWKKKPSWYLIPKDDRTIPPDAQRGMAARARATVREIPGSHAVYVSTPEAVAALIDEATASTRGARTGR